jgi:two-component system, chemotaxis family, sensor histidine kinase and response regulator WspE
MSSDDLGDLSMLDLFREEAETQLAVLTDGLVALEATAEPRQVLDALMRAAHSMKGAARIVGIDPLVKIAHAMEDLFVAALADELTVRPDHVDVLLAAVDFIAQVTTGDGSALVARASEVPALLERLAALRQAEGPVVAMPVAPVDAGGPAAGAAPSAEVPPTAVDLADLSMLDLFREEAETQLAVLTDGLVALEATAEPRQVLDALMRAAHSMKGAARIVGIDPLVKITHAMEDLFVAALADELTVRPDHVDVLLAAVDFIAQVTKGDGGALVARAAEVPALLERLAMLRRGEPAVQVITIPVEPAVQVTSKPVEPAVPVISKPGQPTASAAAAKPAAKAIRMTADALERLTGLAAESVVEADRLERMVDGFGEMRAAYRHLYASMSTLGQRLQADARTNDEIHEPLTNAMAALESLRQQISERDDRLEHYARRSANLARRLSRESMASRMLPFGSMLRGFPRLVRDVTRQLGKRCRLEVRGEATRIDREILEQLEAPLNHIVRNALDHGLELPDARVANGKDPEGRLELDAFHRAGRLQVIVRDDGRGIDAERLRTKIVERRLESAENAARLSSEELYEFLFLPGFSTAEQVTELSGRGVGLDAVRTMVQESGGSVTVSSTPGAGTTFTMELPVTRSVTRVLLVRIAGDRYAMPITDIQRALVIGPEALRTVEGRLYFEYEGARIALVPATEILELPESGRSGPGIPVVVVQDGDRCYGLAVDGFEGERNLVVRPLDPRLGDVPDVAAVSTDESGAVVLILDLDELVRSMDALITGGRLLRFNALTAARSLEQTRKRVLVVDDSLTVRQAERQLLENQGYLVDVAVDGVEGWSAVRLGAYDLVVSDVDMPRMNGIELLRRIRADARLADLPVVIVSYKDREEDRMLGLDAGANHYLAKGGFQDAALVNVVADLIGPAEG